MRKGIFSFDPFANRFLRDKKAKIVLHWRAFVVAGLAAAGSLTIWWLKATKCWVDAGSEPKPSGIAGIDVCKSFRILIEGRGLGEGWNRRDRRDRATSP